MVPSDRYRNIIWIEYFPCLWSFPNCDIGYWLNIYFAKKTITFTYLIYIILWQLDPQKAIGKQIGKFCRLCSNGLPILLKRCPVWGKKYPNVSIPIISVAFPILYALQIPKHMVHLWEKLTGARLHCSPSWREQWGSITRIHP